MDQQVIGPTDVQKCLQQGDVVVLNRINSGDSFFKSRELYEDLLYVVSSICGGDELVNSGIELAPLFPLPHAPDKMPDSIRLFLIDFSVQKL